MTRFPSALFGATLLALCTAAAAFFQDGGEALPKAVKVGEASPGFEFVDLDGKPHTFAEFKGKTVLVSLFFET